MFRVGFGLVGGDIFDFGGGFVPVVKEMEEDDLELEVEAVVRLVWSCVNRNLYLFVAFESKVSGRENI